MGRQQLEYFKVNTFKEIQTLSYLGKKKKHTCEWAKDKKLNCYVNYLALTISLIFLQKDGAQFKT